ncbi:Fe-S cluster assembly protein SufD [Simkania negevensis]|uniref:Fe-S cluster assembly protein SufD n=1 Tax=Simkania negevensis TaxID=83561 RepID=A0ABS3AR21_9BACT|nr:Fe-S cluster assembly protein SufD [Simkania negevensis]
MVTEGFRKAIDTAFERTTSQGAMKRLRKKAWDRFNAIGLPTRKQGPYQYVPLRRLYAAELLPVTISPPSQAIVDEHILSECRKSCLVFVNGCYNPSLSNVEALPKKAVILPLSDALRSYGPFLDKRMKESVKEERDSFAMLNAALHDSGLFVYLPPNVVIKDPIQIHHVVTAESPSIMAPRIHLSLGVHAEARVFSTLHHTNNTNHWINQLFDISLEENAHLHICYNTARTASNLMLFSFMRATIKASSVLSSVSLNSGGSAIREDYHVRLIGSGAQALLHGACMLQGKNQMHTNVLMEHVAPNCSSTQLFKSILRDQTRSSFEGKIYIHKEAQKTDAYQLNANILLSDTAIVDSKPNLEIFADDVKASHGCTIGQLDEEQLFYLLTRGISKEAANKLLLYGFCTDVVEKIPLASQHETALEWVDSY